ANRGARPEGGAEEAVGPRRRLRDARVLVTGAQPPCAAEHREDEAVGRNRLPLPLPRALEADASGRRRPVRGRAAAAGTIAIVRLHEADDPVLRVDLIGHLDGEEPVVVVLVTLRAVRLLADRDNLVDLPALAERAEEPELVRQDPPARLEVGIVAVLQALRRDDVHVLADVVRLQAPAG